MERIKLRALTLKDLPQTLEIHRQESYRNLYGKSPFPLNQETEREWYDRILTSNFPTTVFGIELVEKQALVGLSVLDSISMINRSAELELFVYGMPAGNRELFEEALDKTLAFGFHKLGLHRISIQIPTDSEDLTDAYTACGFTRECVLRESIYRDAKYISVTVLALIRKDYEERQAADKTDSRD